VQNSKDWPELTDEEMAVCVKEFELQKASMYADPLLNAIADQLQLETFILKARKTKYFKLKEKEYWGFVNTTPEYVTYTPEQLYQVFKDRVSVLIEAENKNKKHKKEFVIDQYNIGLIKKLCLYFTESDQAEKYGIDLNKGIALMGGVGVGKTMIMQAFAQNQYLSYGIVSSSQISYAYQSQGFEVVSIFTDLIKTSENQFGQVIRGRCYDDIGTEEERKHYGDKVNIMAEILQECYYRHPYNYTHITTNLTPDEVEAFYGLRIRSRMREMFNLFIFDEKSPDRRK
jgi:DNA replication protein DnaC